MKYDQNSNEKNDIWGARDPDQMIFIRKKNESHLARLIEGFENDKTTSKPSDAQQEKPDIKNRYREPDYEDDPWENKEK